MIWISPYASVLASPLLLYVLVPGCEDKCTFLTSKYKYSDSQVKYTFFLRIRCLFWRMHAFSKKGWLNEQELSYEDVQVTLNLPFAVIPMIIDYMI